MFEIRYKASAVIRQQPEHVRVLVLEGNRIRYWIVRLPPLPARLGVRILVSLVVATQVLGLVLSRRALFVVSLMLDLEHAVHPRRQRPLAFLLLLPHLVRRPVQRSFNAHDIALPVLHHALSLDYSMFTFSLASFYCCCLRTASYASRFMRSRCYFILLASLTLRYSCIFRCFSNYFPYYSLDRCLATSSSSIFISAGQGQPASSGRGASTARATTPSPSPLSRAPCAFLSSVRTPSSIPLSWSCPRFSCAPFPAGGTRSAPSKTPSPCSSRRWPSSHRSSCASGSPGSAL